MILNSQKRMPKAIFFIAALICLFVFNSKPYAQTQIIKYNDYAIPIPAKSHKFKVMTYNILGNYHPDLLDWNIRKEGIFEIIEEAKPDIFALQEDTLVQTNDVRDHFISEYKQVQFTTGITGHGQGSDQSYGSIFYDPSKFKNENQGEFNHSGGGNSYARWVKFRHTASDEILFVSNIHLTYHANSSVSTQIQLNSVQSLANTMWNIVGDNSYISLGDMNNLATTKAMRYLTNAKGVEAGMTYHEDHKKLQFNLTQSTLHRIVDSSISRDGPHLTNGSIDHILTSETLTKPTEFQRYYRFFKTSDYSISQPCSYPVLDPLNCRARDHWAVMATIGFK